MDGLSQLFETDVHAVSHSPRSEVVFDAQRRAEDVEPELLIPPSSALRTLSPSDRRLFRVFGSGETVAPRHKTIHTGFKAFARQQPDAVAVRHRDGEISYGRLDAEAHRLATILAEHGVGRGDAVCLFLERSIPMVVGILAALKVGAAYVPQHVGVAPPTMLSHIANVTGSRVILTLSALADQVPVAAGQALLAIDNIMAQPPGNEGQATVSALVHPDDRCFILFTSGTTGTPNGVQVTHRNVCNILQTSPGDLGIRPGMTVAQILSIAFDMAAWEILGCLSNGGMLLIREKDIQRAVEQADVVIATPSILGSLDQRRCRNVKVAAVAGEPCPRPLADTWGRFCTFYNSCGPTETTIINTAEQHYPTKPTLSIGRPTPNNTVYVLNDDMKPCAIGEAGEMWAGGDCVTGGYLANDDLTADRYRPDPFLGGGRTMFRTRDLGRWTSDGELEHLGRVDDQVKIRGFRVELDSVSTVLESVAGCRQAVTLKYDARSLVAFVSPSDVDVSQAARAVAERLPYYCEPAFILALDALPRTPRGKIDKRLLMAMAEDFQKDSKAAVA
ncbi:MAG: amino acid adenylation domain-containing protein [bacterium]|nr:amino acid adenylation domain-containing protein [bacterium]MCP4305614.1 amino acid adenylation domain-containing protein [bacterium]